MSLAAKLKSKFQLPESQLAERSEPTANEANPLAGAPASSAFLVENRVKRLAASSAVTLFASLADELAEIETIMQRRYGPYVVAHGRPICKCGCDWTEDFGTAGKVKSVCVMCRTEIF
ncbi:MAG: hypothetical protein ACOVLE_15535 [Pirellula staleyi]